MKIAGKTKFFNKTILSGAISTALSVGMGLGVTTVSQADIYEFSYDGLFTMLDPAGLVFQNKSYPYYGDTTWGYGLRTQVKGTMLFDTGTGKGTGTVTGAADAGGYAGTAGFPFANAGNAVASGVEMQALPASTLVIGNMNFNWNGSDITTQIVLDAAGMFSAIQSGVIGVGDILGQGGNVPCTTTGVSCATPASETSLPKGKYPIGPTPIATSSFNTAGQTGFGTPLTALSLGTDDAIGGSPMDNGPFIDYNANFDFLATTVTGYNDMTKPELTFSPAAQVSIDLNSIFNENNPGVVVNCVDNADGSGTLNTDGTSSNASLSFGVNATDLAALDTSTSGAYTIRYNCSDSASARTALDDPNNPGTPIVTVDNISADATFTVVVADPDAPVITILNDGQPTIHEACTVYNDAGATATDPQDGDLTGAIIPTDVNGIFGQELPAGTPDATVKYDVSDTGASNRSGTVLQPVTRIRTVKTVDSLAPILTIGSFAPGNATTTIEVTDQAGYVIPDATSVDANSCSAVNSGGVVATADTVNFSVPDGQDSVTSTLTYTDSDVVGNSASVTLTVVVERSKPVITLLDDAGQPVSVGDIVLSVGGAAYTEYGMNIHDVQGGDLTGVTATGSAAGNNARPGQGNIDYTITGSVDINTVGSYPITYTATDSDGNSTSVIRNVEVAAGVGIGNFTMLDPAGIVAGGTNDVTYAWNGSFSNPAGTEPDGDGYTVPSDTSSVMTIASPTKFSGFNWAANKVRVYKGPAKLKFDVTCTEADSTAGNVICNNKVPGTQTLAQKADQQYIKLDLADGEIGAHMKFDWGAEVNDTACGRANCDIDVILRWKENGVWNDVDGDGVADLSRDSDGDGVADADGGKLLLDPPYLLVDDQGNLAPPALDTVWALVSMDVPEDGIPGGKGDGFNGRPMIDGPFNGYHANFNLGPGSAGVQKEKVVSKISDVAVDKIAFSMGFWSLMAGLLSVFGLRRINNKK